MTLPRRRHLDVEQLQAVSAWLAPRLPGDGDVIVEPLNQTTGNSHQIFTVRRGTARWVLRVAPPRPETGSAGGFDLHHEWRVLRAIAGSAIPHAGAVLIDDDSSPIDNDLLVIDYIEGDVLHGPLPARIDSEQEARAVVDSVVDALVAISSFDYEATELTASGDERTYLPRQVAKGRRMLEEARTRDTADIDRLMDRLEANLPAASSLSLIHGDYSTMNIMVAPDAPRVAAVLDWETATIGDALIDIGYLTARWTPPEENPILAAFTVGGPNPADHRLLPDRGYLADRFAQASGRSLAELPFYQGFAMARLVAALEPRVARAHAKGDDQTAAMFAGMVDSCAQHGLRLLDKS